MAYGNTSVSALLNQARAALKKQQGFEEQVAAYEYDLSPKDQASYEKYASFLNNRIKQVQATDPGKALSLQRLITGAQRSFTSSELTRESIAIAEGNGSKPQKLNKMISLYRRALENGDENLAQRIQLQADNLQVQIQNEAMAGAGRGGFGGGGGGSSRKTPDQVNLENQIAQLKSDLQYTVGAVKSGGNKALGDIEKLGNGQSYFGTVKGIIENIAQTYQQLANSTDDPNKKQDYMENAQAALDGKYDVGFGSGKSLDDINRYIVSRGTPGAGNPTSLSVKPDGTYGFIENKAAGSMYVAGPDGKPQLVTKYALGGDQNYDKYAKAAVEKLGKFTQGKIKEDGTIEFNNPVTGQQVFGTADQYGNILYHTVDDQGNDVIRRYVTGENKDEQVSQQEQEAILRGGNAVDQNSNRLVRDPMEALGYNIQQASKNPYINPIAAAGVIGKDIQNSGILNNPYVNPLAAAQKIGQELGSDPTLKPFINKLQKPVTENPFINPLAAASDIKTGLEDTVSNAGEVLRSADLKKKVGSIASLAGTLGINNPFSQASGFVGGALGVANNIQSILGNLQKKKAEVDAVKAAEAARQQAALAESIRQTQAQAAAAAQARNNTVLNKFNPNNYTSNSGSAPDPRSIAVVNQGITGDPFSRAGIGVNSLYRLPGSR